MIISLPQLNACDASPAYSGRRHGFKDMPSPTKELMKLVPEEKITHADTRALLDDG